eukprot:1388657-Amorphochlora_amoeboformis.AAC.1
MGKLKLPLNLLLNLQLLPQGVTDLVCVPRCRHAHTSDGQISSDTSQFAFQIVSVHVDGESASFVHNQTMGFGARNGHMNSSSRSKRRRIEGGGTGEHLAPDLVYTLLTTYFQAHKTPNRASSLEESENTFDWTVCATSRMLTLENASEQHWQRGVFGIIVLTGCDYPSFSFQGRAYHSRPLFCPTASSEVAGISF